MPAIAKRRNVIGYFKIQNMKLCAYCNKEGKLTKEHIWPKCLLNRMPELEAKYVDSIKKFVPSELVISDVCAECNNKKLSLLDSYLCQLYDVYFKFYVETKQEFTFEYNYDLLIRSLLKITYNSSRTVQNDVNDFIKFREYIIDGGKIYENIVVKLDIVTPSIVDGVKVYPKSARCGKVDVGIKLDNFILRIISINSFYFYIIISKDEFIEGNSLNEFHEVFSRVPGTIVHPYRQTTLINKFSDSNTYSAHIDWILKSENNFKDYIDKKNNR